MLSTGVHLWAFFRENVVQVDWGWLVVFWTAWGHLRPLSGDWKISGCGGGQVMKPSPLGCCAFMLTTQPPPPQMTTMIAGIYFHYSYTQPLCVLIHTRIRKVFPVLGIKFMNSEMRKSLLNQLATHTVSYGKLIHQMGHGTRQHSFPFLD